MSNKYWNITCRPKMTINKGDIVIFENNELISLGNDYETYFSDVRKIKNYYGIAMNEVVANVEGILELDISLESIFALMGMCK